MIWSVLAIALALMIIAALAAWAYASVPPITPDPREVTDQQVEDIICGTGTEAPRRGV
jgi:hypothetical protein